MKASLEQINELSIVANKLWPEHTFESVADVLIRYIKGDETAVFALYVHKRCVGVALASLRHDYVEGCDTSPVGYLEGIYVEEGYRKGGIARSLCKECEDWAKEKGCSEFASDCELNNHDSYEFHLAVGFEEENRIIHFMKKL